jgi:hypothetical protein
MSFEFFLQEKKKVDFFLHFTEGRLRLVPLFSAEQNHKDAVFSFLKKRKNGRDGARSGVSPVRV